MVQKDNGGLGDKTARLLARELSREGKTTDYTESLISAAGETGAENCIVPMREMLKDEKTPLRTRLAIIDAFGKIGDKSVEGLLINLVDDDYEEKDIRARAILALGEMDSTQSIDTMKTIVENTYEPKIMRMYAVLSLSKIGKASVLETLEKALLDKDHDVATYAAKGIADLECTECGRVLMKALRSDYDRVRYYAIIGLSKLRYKESEEILKFKAEYDTNVRVREEAKKALESLAADTEEKE
ncbi:MAG: HEAT repeat domain-containing protein [Spirochaetes bacterium]|nr:HEAT repeat domain-containing protein [Spirochaetota bacterium]